jgi:transposase
MAVAPWIVSDELWGLVEPLLPKTERRFPYPGRKRLPDRQALQGVLFVLHTGISWTHLPAELGGGSGVTCWRRLDDGSRQGSGSGCTSSCSLVCERRARSNGRGRSPTLAMCRRKRGLRDGEGFQNPVHAAARYSWMSPPSRSWRSIFALAGRAAVFPASGGTSASARCGRSAF